MEFHTGAWISHYQQEVNEFEIEEEEGIQQEEIRGSGIVSTSYMDEKRLEIADLMWVDYQRYLAYGGT